MTIGTINDTGVEVGDWVLIHPLHIKDDYSIKNLESYLGTCAMVRTVLTASGRSRDPIGIYPLLTVFNSVPGKTYRAPRWEQWYFIGRYLIKVHPDKKNDPEYIQQLIDFHTDYILSREPPEVKG